MSEIHVTINPTAFIVTVSLMKKTEFTSQLSMRLMKQDIPTNTMNVWATEKVIEVMKRINCSVRCLRERLTE